MGCGGNCACDEKKSITSDEIVEATAPDGTDITAEVKASVAGDCSSDNCQDGKCERCLNEGKDHDCKSGDSCSTDEKSA